MLLKGCTQHARKFGKLSHGHGTGKGQFSFQSKRKAMPKNAQTTQMGSFHMLAQNPPSSASTFCESNVPAGFRKGRGTRDQIANIHSIIEKTREFQKNICSLTSLKPLTVWNTNHGIFLMMGIPDHLPSEKSVCRSRSNS